MTLTLEQFGLDKLTLDEKHALVGVLQESIEAEEHNAPPDAELLAELDRRIAAADADPSLWKPFDEVVRVARARWGRSA